MQADAAFWDSHRPAAAASLQHQQESAVADEAVVPGGRVSPTMLGYSPDDELGHPLLPSLIWDESSAATDATGCSRKVSAGGAAFDLTTPEPISELMMMLISDAAATTNSTTGAAAGYDDIGASPLRIGSDFDAEMMLAELLGQDAHEPLGPYPELGGAEAHGSDELWAWCPAAAAAVLPLAPAAPVAPRLPGTGVPVARPQRQRRSPQRQSPPPPPPPTEADWQKCRYRQQHPYQRPQHQQPCRGERDPTTLYTDSELKLDRAGWAECVRAKGYALRPAEQKALTKLRRAKKSCVYADNQRAKRAAKFAEVDASHAMLEAEVARLKGENVALVKKLAAVRRR